MQPHQQRVVEEKEALDIKLEALNNFIDNNHAFLELEVVEQGLLYAQAYAMRAFSDILADRIEAF